MFVSVLNIPNVCTNLYHMLDKFPKKVGMNNCANNSMYQKIFSNNNKLTTSNNKTGKYFSMPKHELELISIDQAHAHIPDNAINSQ